MQVKTKRRRKRRLSAGTSVGRAVPAASSDVAAPPLHDEPALSGAGENPETDMASTLLSHPIADRLASVETDVAASAMDDAPSGAIPADPSACPAGDGRALTADDLH
jgi:hypothetical protein